MNQAALQSSSLAALIGRQIFHFCGRRGPRRVLLAWCLLLGSHAARGADVPVAETNLIPEHVSLYSESMLWDQQLSVSSGLGYKDNVLLSAYHPSGSGFFINGLEFTAIRLPLDGWEIEGSVAGDDTRYWHDAGTSSEDSFIGNIKVARELGGGWKPGFAVLGGYVKEVLDISPPQGISATALVAGEELSARPSLRKDLGLNWWAQVEMPVTRWWLAGPLDDYWTFGPEATVGYHVGTHADLTLSYGASYEDHDFWMDAEYGDGASSSDFPARKLEIFQHRGELAWRQYWDKHQRWRSSTQLVFADLADNGGGYYNEYEYQLIASLRWQTDAWMVKGSAEINYEDYPVQWTGTLNNNTLYRDLWAFSGEVERRLWKGLRTFAKVAYQRSHSNEDLKADDYGATTVSGGLRYEF